jgi:thioredoxin 1
LHQKLTNPPRRWAQDPEYKDKTYFAKFDVDQVPELAQELGVRAMPTFVFFKDGEKVDEFVGANPPALLNMLKQYNPEEAEAAETAEETAKSDAPEADLPK